jgi:hypothetical protein
MQRGDIFGMPGFVEPLANGFQRQVGQPRPLDDETETTACRG